MWDTTVAHFSLAMRVDSLEDLPFFAVPERYGWRFYQPGDELFWARIETSAEEFKRPEEGLAGFERAFAAGGRLEERMFFLTDGGVPFATATAWHQSDTEGLLHWVSVDAAHQGQGLSKPVVSLAMQRLRKLGYRSAYLTTQTESWLAIRLYHRFGFRPVLRSEEERGGWKVVSEKSGIDFLQYI